MRLGNIDDLRMALGGGQKFGASRTYASAMKQAAGYKTSGRFDVDAVLRWYANNKDFQVRDTYPYKEKKKEKKKKTEVQPTA